MGWSARIIKWFRRKLFVLGIRIRPYRERLVMLWALFSTTIVLMNSSLLELALDEGYKEEVRQLLRFFLILVIPVAAFLVTKTLKDIFFGKRIRLVTPSRDIRNFTATPYSVIPGKPTDIELQRLGTLASDVEDEFVSDTFRKEIVNRATAAGCCVGLQVAYIKEGGGSHDIGFFDVYQLTSEALLGWIHGNLAEREMEESHFLPISRTRRDKHINLIVGAIMLSHPDPMYNFYICPLLASSSMVYLSNVFSHCETITIYASIYSEAGERYARFFGFSHYLGKDARGKHSDGHDIYRLIFKPKDPNKLFMSCTRDSTYFLRLLSNPV